MPAAPHPLPSDQTRERSLDTISPVHLGLELLRLHECASLFVRMVSVTACKSLRRMVSVTACKSLLGPGGGGEWANGVSHRWAQAVTDTIGLTSCLFSQAYLPGSSQISRRQNQTLQKQTAPSSHSEDSNSSFHLQTLHHL